MSSPLEALEEAERALLRPAGPPETASAMKAVLTDMRFSDPGWIYERKLDGIRRIAIRSGAEVRMVSRNGVGFTELTRHGRLRHPRFLGLRFDKAAHDVVREP